MSSKKAQIDELRVHTSALIDKLESEDKNSTYWHAAFRDVAEKNEQLGADVAKAQAEQDRWRRLHDELKVTSALAIDIAGTGVQWLDQELADAGYPRHDQALRATVHSFYGRVSMALADLKKAKAELDDLGRRGQR